MNLMTQVELSLHRDCLNEWISNNQLEDNNSDEDRMLHIFNDFCDDVEISIVK